MKILRITEGELNQIIAEQVNKIITEAFKSNMLRDFFQQHGGTNKDYRQFSLGDIDDSQIGYARVFNSANEADEEKNKLTRPDKYTRKRSDYDMKYLFHIFTANDGKAILVGVDRNTIQTGMTWGGEQQKKVADRYWRNQYNHKNRNGKYADDSDTYYYESPAKDFGVHTNQGLQHKNNGIQQQKQRMDKEQYQQWRKQQIQHMKDYLQKYYPKQFDKLNKNNNSQK